MESYHQGKCADHKRTTRVILKNCGEHLYSRRGKGSKIKKKKRAMKAKEEHNFK